MSNPAGRESQACLLVYDGQCRLCITAKKGLDRLETQVDSARVRMVPYQSEEAREALGEGYRPGRPDVAYLVRPDGQIASGLDAFLALLPGLKGGRILAAFFNLSWVKPFGYLVYRLIARYRYAVFGRVPLSKPPDIAPKSEIPPKLTRKMPDK